MSGRNAPRTRSARLGGGSAGRATVGFSARLIDLKGASEGRQLPETRKPHKNIDAAGDCGAVAEKGGHKIEIEGAHEASLYSAYDDQEKGDEIDDFHCLSSIGFWVNRADSPPCSAKTGIGQS